jgi:thiamine kinase-like enzyme
MGRTSAEPPSGPDGLRLPGQTNRVVLSERAGRRVVVRTPGPSSSEYINRVAELHNASAASKAGLAPELIEGGADGTLVWDYVETPIARTGAIDAGEASAVARLLARLHGMPTAFLGRWDPFERTAAYLAVARRLGATIPDGMQQLDEPLRHLGRVIGPLPELRPCHNDAWTGNLVGPPGEPLLIDWEYAAMGDPVWDLANFAVESGLSDDLLLAMLDEHGRQLGQALDVDRVRLQTPLCDVVWSAWALIQQALGNQADDYGSYAARRLARAGVRLMELGLT